MDVNKPNYYIYAEEKYSVRFPLQWATNHISKTGPNDCAECKCNGSWNGVFIGYCSNCAITMYEGHRGRGFSYPGVENTADEVLYIDSMFTTYLRNLCLDEIGDKNIEDTQSLLRNRSRDQSIARYVDTKLLDDNKEENKIIRKYLSSICK